MLPSYLECSEHPSVTLSRKCFYAVWSFCQSYSILFIENFVSELSYLDSQIRIFCQGIRTKSTCLSHETRSPGTHSSWDDSYTVEHDKSSSIEILAHDILECLPAGHEIHPISDLGISGDRSDFLVFEMPHEIHNRILGKDGICVECDQNIRVCFGDTEVEGSRFSRVLDLIYLYPCIVSVLSTNGLVGAVLGTIIYDYDLKILRMLAREERCYRLIDDFFFVIRRDYDRD